MPKASLGRTLSGSYFTETAIRTAEKGWTHYTQIKGTQSSHQEKQWAVTQNPDLLRLTEKDFDYPINSNSLKPKGTKECSPICY